MFTNFVVYKLTDPHGNDSFCMIKDSHFYQGFRRIGKIVGRYAVKLNAPLRLVVRCDVDNKVSDLMLGNVAKILSPNPTS